MATTPFLHLVNHSGWMDGITFYFLNMLFSMQHVFYIELNEP